MDDRWQFQLRLDASAELGVALREGAARPEDKALFDVLRRHGATLKCQFDAFNEYVDEAEARGADGYPLYAWTRATIEDPAKKAKYLRVFTVYVDGNEVYGKGVTDALESDLFALGKGAGIERIASFDTNPANNPQPPATP
ncbi:MULTISPECIES: hypothetical protein [unclassified Caballeronia]|uniref:hypothetical protein n=1 Tax=unclassified Caballeronia TaxID=2646786 RepID=UPI0028609C07|nr:MULTISPECIES: hypothetical protein [unclassified Caballeronia]MDR5753478.1 hypothetical protein [Caballeronia sp. LZ024]MDR5839857.1 hypothetical protein [Caballeronia sp. LZ031]